MTVGEALLTPTKIYVKLALDLIEKHNIKAIAHITGGGVIENITRVIPKGLGLNIDTKSWEKPPIFKMIEGFNAVEQRELHKSFKIHSKQFVYETLTDWGLNPEKTYSFKGKYLEEQKMVVFGLKSEDL